MDGETNCLFCKIIRGEIPSPPVFENEYAMAFNDIQPQAPTHVLVVPKRHLSMIAEAEDPQVLGHVFFAACEVARQKGLSDYRLVVNNGAEAGQSVFHLHVHLLAGRPFSWPPG